MTTTTNRDPIEFCRQETAQVSSPFTPQRLPLYNYGVHVQVILTSLSAPCISLTERTLKMNTLTTTDGTQAEFESSSKKSPSLTKIESDVQDAISPV